MHIALYHGIATELDAFEKVFQKHILLSEFSRQLDHIQKHYNALTTDAFFEKWRTESLGDNDILITFDDCYRNVMNAANLLAEHGLPAMFAISSDVATRNYSWTDDVEKAVINTQKEHIEFADFSFDVSTEVKKFRTVLILKDYFKNLFVDKNRERLKELIAACEVDPKTISDDKFNMITWDDVKKLQANPLFTIVHHGHEHFPMSKFRTISEIEAEIDASVQVLKEKIGVDPFVFVYPFGMAEHYDERVKGILKSRGFSYAFAVNNEPVGYRDAYEIPRIELTLARFKQFIEKNT